MFERLRPLVEGALGFGRAFSGLSGLFAFFGMRDVILAGIALVLAALFSWFTSAADIPALQSYGWGMYALIGVGLSLAVLVTFAVAFLIMALARNAWQRGATTRPVGLPTAASQLPNEDFAAIQLSTTFEGADNDFVVIAVVKITKPARDVVVFARSAQCIHTLSGAHWRWELPKRLLSNAKMYKGERVSLEILRRAGAGRDRVIALDKEVRIEIGHPTVNLFQVEIVASSEGEEQVEKRQAYQFFPEGTGKISQPLELSNVPYIITDTGSEIAR